MSSIDASRQDKHRRGAALILVLFLLIVVVGMVAFAADVGLMVLLRSQVQNAVDSGALAAALVLQAEPGAVQEAEDAARDYIQRNRTGMALRIPSNAIEVEQGTFDVATRVFTATDDSPNAVRVFARQDNELFFFGRIFGRTTYGAPASAVASSPTVADIMLVLDLSGSMAEQGRIEALWNAAPLFIDVIEYFGGDDQIGVMGLSAQPSAYDPGRRGHAGVEYNSGLHRTADHHVGVLEARLTTNYNNLRNVTLRSSNLPANKYTNFTGTGAALGDAAHYLTYGAEARSQAMKFMVLMSDGHANRPSSNGPGYAREMAYYAQRNNVAVYTISLGDEADLSLMQQIADITGGEHYDATGTGEDMLTERLRQAFGQAAAAIKRVQLVQ